MNCIPDFQFGFRSGHSTYHALAYLINNVKLELNNRKTTAAVYFDIAKAFDSVWHSGLIVKMIDLGIPKNLISLIKSFLTERKFKVHIGTTSSSSRPIKYGVPQGSVLSPLLYNIFVHDIPQPRDCKITLYADDTVIFASSRYIKGLVRNIQTGVKKVTNFYKKWKISLNPNKTQVMFHTKRKCKQLPPTTVKILGEEISVQKEVKYLGIWLDNRMNLKLHTQKMRVKGDHLLRMFYPYMRKYNFLTKKMKLKIYKTYIRPALLYGAPLIDRLSSSNLKVLQRQQNKFLRLVLNKRRRSRIVTMHNETKLGFVGEFLGRLHLKFNEKCRNSENRIIQNL